MEVTLGYKQTEVGVLPDDWELDHIENVALITTGSKNTQDRVEDGLYPFFVRSQTVERINSYSFDGEAVLTAGDGVGTGKVFHYINGRFDVHQRVYRISNFSERIIGYFFFLYFSTHFYNRIMQMTAKSSADSVRRDMIARMLVPIPPTKAEQRAIATALSDADALAGALDQLIAKKRNLKQAAMQELLTGARRLPGFDTEWEAWPFSKLFEFLRTANNPRAHLSPFDDVGYIHYGDIHTTDSAFLDCARVGLPKIADVRVAGIPLVENGDLVMADASEDYAGLGKCVEIQGAEGQRIVAGLHTFLLRGNKELLANGFKGYVQFIPSFRADMIRLATGISVYGVSKSNVRNIAIRIPKMAEQIAIASVLADMDVELSVLEDRRDKIRALKQGMMQALLTGRTRLL